MSYYQRLFADNLVAASSLDDFMHRYRRADRFALRSEAERESIRRCHESEIRADGIAWVAGYDSNTGQLVAWIPPSVTAVSQGKLELEVA